MVRETLGERGVREAAIRRLRSSRNSYESLIRMLSLVSVAGTSSLALALLARETGLAWPLLVLAVAASAFGAIVAGTLVDQIIFRLGLGRLIIFGVIAQMLLWPLLFIPRMAKLGIRTPAARPETNGSASAEPGVEHTESALQVEEEIADEPLEVHERAMIHAILHLDETPVREIMVPRVDVVSLDVASTLDEAVPRMLDSGHSRLPVFEENPDNVVGILYSRDLLTATARGRGAAPPVLRDLVRPCFFVPESKRVDEMLREFQERRVHLAVVVDEYGGVAGIVTIEDLLEEIVGEIEDEFDIEEPTVERRSSGDAVVDARMSIDSFNDEFTVEISQEGFDTLGGFLFARLGRIPTAGELVEEAGLRIQVITTVGRRVKKVLVTRAPQAVEAEHADHAGESA